MPVFIQGEHPDGRIGVSKYGDIDITGAKFSIEVKSGGTKAKDILKYAELAKKQNKNFAVYGPDIQGSVEKDLQKAKIKVIKTEADLMKFIEENK